MKIGAGTRVIVTGAGSGLGRALSLDLARRGAKILAADINLADAEATAGMLRGAGDAFAVHTDVTKADEVAALGDEADRRFGGVDILINNAGVAVSGLVGEISLADWQWIMGVNLWGVIYGCHHFVPRFRKQGHGAILNVASAAGLLSPPQMAPYAVTKTAVVALSESLAAELKGSGVSISVLCPTFFRTHIIDSARGADDRARAFTEKLMARSKIQADGVARIALDGVEKEQLYVLPHADGRWFWRLKRTLPNEYIRLVGLVQKRGMLSGKR